VRKIKPPNLTHLVISIFKVAWMGYKSKEPRLYGRVLEDIDMYRPPRKKLSLEQQQLLEKVYFKIQSYSQKSNKHRKNREENNGNYELTGVPGTLAGSTEGREMFYDGKKNSPRGGSYAGEDVV
jgi:hypothetical protein